MSSPGVKKSVLAGQGVRFWLFAATGLALPLFAFPVAKIRATQIDLATILAALFVAASLPLLGSRAVSREARLLFAFAAAVPLLALIPQRPASFQLAAFASSYGHWLLVVGFFVFATALEISGDDAERLLVANSLAGIAVALFALYQIPGIPRRWPGAGPRLVPFQRGPFQFEMIGAYVRPTSVFLEPAWMGGYLTWILILAVSLFFLTARPSRRVVALVCGGLSFLAIVATVSWGAYAGLFAAAAVGGVMALRRRTLRLHQVAPWIAAAAVVILLAGLSSPGRRVAEAIEARSRALFETPVAAATLSRKVHVDSSWIRYRNMAHTARVFRSRPVRGVGLGQYASYSRFGESAGLWFADPWCGWATIAAEAGVLGPFVLAGAIALVLFRWRSFRLQPGLAVVPALCALAFVQQLHTGSFIDLWWWFPLSLAAVLGGPGRR